MSAAGQDGATVAGRAVDARSGTALPFVTVVVTGVEGVDTLSLTSTRNDGRFIIGGLAAGQYSVRLSHLGFAPQSRSLLVSELNSSYDLGDVALSPVLEVEGVEVAVDAVDAAGTDTQVFRLDQGANQTTGSVLDAMRNLPGVTIDQDGNVLLRGSDQVAILIDGRQSSLTGLGSQRGLDNVSAANIQAIEIINNPSARFDADGMAGIVNIIYKQDQQQGLSGDLALSLGMGQFSRQRSDLPTDLGSFTNNQKIRPSLSLTWNTGSVRTFAQGEFLFQDDLPNNEFTTRFYDDGRVIESQVPENREQTHYTARAGADFFLNASNTLTVSGIYDVETHTDRAEVPFILASTGERERFWFWREKETTGFANASANFNHRFANPGHELDVNLQFTRGWEDEAYFLNEVSPVRTGSDMTDLAARENTLPLSIDYTRPLASGRIELGAKLQRRWLPINYTVDRGVQSVIYEGLGDFSDWDEDLFAAYVNLVRATPTYSLEFGLRAEQTDVSYTIPDENIYYDGSDTYDYFELFPNVRVTRTLGNSYRVIAAYNRRIDRPGEPELRIFPKYDDPELLKVGNPFLRPQLTNVFEVGLGRDWERGSLTASGYLRDIDDQFLRVFAIDSSNPEYDVVNKIYQNAGNSTQTGIELVAEQQILEPWGLSASVNWFIQEIDALETTLLFPTARPFSLAASSDDTWDFTLNNRVTLPGGGETQLSYIYYAARNVPQGRERARSSIDLAASWPLLDARAEVVFTFTDILNDFAVQRDIDGNGFTALYENFLETQVATIGLKLGL